jgi:hypothetical protein
MEKLYADIFIFLCILLLLWGVTRPERAYQYPFIMGFILVSFIVPQALAILQDPRGLPNGALERTFLYSCFCAAACWIGYQIQPRLNWVKALTFSIDDQRLQYAGVILGTMGHLFYFLIRNTVIQKTDVGTWTGVATIYYFLFQVIYIAFAIFLMQLLKSPNFLSFLGTVITSLPLIETVMGGRRQPTMTVAIIVGLSFYFVKRTIPPRWFFVSMVISTLFLIPVVGALRNGFWVILLSGDWNQLFAEIFNSFSSLMAGEILELRNASFLMDAADRMNEFGLGKGYWDVFVFQYVPAQILGAGFKNSLQFNEQNFDLESMYGYVIHTGTTLTGIGDTYLEFSYFGCFVFILLAYLFKHLWLASVYRHSVPCQLLYIGSISPVMLAITHGTGRFLQEFIFQLIFASLIAIFCRKKTQSTQNFSLS